MTWPEPKNRYLAPMRAFLPLLLLALLALSAPLHLARAETAPWTAELLPGWRTADGRHFAALRLQLLPGWKTYWRAPGEAGIPPRFDLSASGNLQEFRLHWPRPVMFLSGGMPTIGYHDQLLLPIELSPKDPTAPVDLRLKADVGICNKICTPVQLRVEAYLPPSGQADAAIKAALADVPGAAEAAGLRAARCAMAAIPDGLRVTATLDMPPLGSAETGVLESADPNHWIGSAETHRDGAALVISADIVGPPGAPLQLARQDLRLTILTESRAVEHWGCTP